jgi:ribosomal protein S18 acetylase RimI-like enzyme
MYQHIKDLIIQDSTAAGLRLYVDLSNERARKVYQALGMNGEHYQVFEWMKEF